MIVTIVTTVTGKKTILFSDTSRVTIRVTVW